MAVSAPYFVPKHRDTYWEIMQRAYAQARLEAIRIARAKSIPMKVEFLKPVHLDRTLYNLPGSTDTLYTLKSDVAIIPFGVLNEDPTWTNMKWWKGNKTQYVSEWFVRPVYNFEEKEGAYAGKLGAYVFRGPESFTINCGSTTSSVVIEGWLLGFAVAPTTLEEIKIIA